MVSYTAGERAARLMVALALTAVMVYPTGSVAQVTTSITSSGLGTTITQAGTTYDITGGTRRGSNLFHSFGLFSVGAGDIGNFLNDTGLATSNIVGRVTGGQTSSIFGTIRTTGFGSANLFLINPFGWIFGPSASLDVGGSFHVSTADYVRFSDGAKFHADLSQNSVLTAAAPAAFGFLGPPAPISVEGAALVVQPGQTLSLVGGDVQIVGGALIAPGGLVQIGSVASAGEALLGAPNLDLGSFARLGQVSISDGAFVTAGSDGILPGGTVVIRSGQLIVDNAFITTNTFDLAGAPVGIDLGATDSIVLRNGAVVQTASFGAGDASGISIVTENLAVTDFAAVESLAFSAGRTGDIDIQVGRADILNGTIRTSSLASGAGDITIDASDNVTLSGPTGEISTGTFITDDPNILAGNISLSAKNLILRDHAKIRSGSVNEQAGESLSIMATGSVRISGLAGISSQAFSGNAGTVEVSARQLMMNAGYINTSTLGSGNAGPVFVNANTVSLTNGAQIASSSQIVASGAGGNITINSPGSVTISGVGPQNGVGSITFTGSPRSGIFSNASGFGAGGNISIDTGKLQISGGAIVSAESTGTSAVLGGNPGNAGSVSIVTGDTLRMDNGTITTAAAEAGGGDITIRHRGSGSLLHMTDSQITTSVKGGNAQGGNITIGAVLDPTTLKPLNVNPFDFIVLNNSGIHANAFGGPGGNINIFSNLFLSSLPISTAVTASSALSTPGTIDIQGIVTDVSREAAQLSEAPLQATELLRASCSARLAGGKSSSLVVTGRDGVPIEPGGLLSSPLYLGTEPAVSSASRSRFSLFGSSDDRIPLRLGWDQFQLAKAALGFGCS